MTPCNGTIERLERELKIGPYAHPYGTTTEGLTDEVRVEMEAEWRSREQAGEWGCMPPCVERMRLAGEEARRRWPAYFAAADPLPGERP